MNKKLFKGMLIFISYFIYSSFQLIPLKILGINYDSFSLNARVIYTLLYELAYILILIILYRKTFKEDIKDYIKNFKTYMKKYMDYWAIAFILMVVSNVVITTLLPSSTATNQELIDEMFKTVPIYIIISSVVYAPFIEETIFRLSLRNVFKSDKLFIIMSGFVFGALHVVSSFETVQDLAYIITYAIPGFAFAYALVKSKNIFVPMSLHLFHNGFMTLLQVVVSFLM